MIVEELIALLQEQNPKALVVNLDRLKDQDVRPGFWNGRARLPWRSKATGGKNEVPAVHLGFWPSK